MRRQRWLLRVVAEGRVEKLRTPRSWSGIVRNADVLHAHVLAKGGRFNARGGGCEKNDLGDRHVCARVAELEEALHRGETLRVGKGNTERDGCDVRGS